MGVLFFVLIIVAILSFCGQASATAECKRKGREAFNEAIKNDQEWHRQKSKEGDYYFDPVLKKCDWDFYSDGSLRRDGNKYYPKGQYHSNSAGYGPMCHKASPDAKRPPKN